ncbi:MAG: hypothetical protein JXA42_23680, partial [Anaerolineales bacterium]|nr:hypothetical protein [Anaerolineales bacterium]
MKKYWLLAGILLVSVIAVSGISYVFGKSSDPSSLPIKDDSLALTINKINEINETITWVGGTTGLWSVGSNWSTGVVPGVGDNVNIGSGNTV